MFHDVFHVSYNYNKVPGTTYFIKILGKKPLRKIFNVKHSQIAKICEKCESFLLKWFVVYGTAYVCEVDHMKAFTYLNIIANASNSIEPC